MLKILLIDDEDLELEGLESMIQGLNLDFLVCGKARNGVQGLELAERLRPDVILSDVKMPKMDGIEMAQELQRAGIESYLIFISGYQDFVAAQEAVNLGARAYLLKPVNCESLKKILIQAGGSVLKREQEREEKKMIHQQKERLERWSKSAALKKLMLKKNLSEEEREEAAFQIKIPFVDGWFAVGIFKVGKLDEDYVSENDLPEILCEIAEKQNAFQPVLIRSNEVAFLFNYPAMLPEKTVVDYLMAAGEELVTAAVKQWDETGIRFYMGGPERQMNGIPKLTEQAEKTMQESRWMGSSFVIFYEEQPDNMTIQAVKMVEQII